jgi:hypothetical protein
MPKGTGTLYDIACPSAADCWAVGYNSLLNGPILVATEDGGGTWHAEALPGDVGLLNSIVCVNTSDCWAAGAAGAGTVAGAVITTTNGGRTWAATIVTAVATLQGVACANAVDCWAVGFNPSFSAGAVVATTDGGGVWTTEAAPPGGDSGLFDVACPSTTDCFAAGYLGGNGAVLTTRNGGLTWAEKSQKGTGSLYGIACANSINCATVGSSNARVGSSDEILRAGSALRTADSGLSWASDTIPSSIDGLFDVSCATSKECSAVGYTSSFAVVLSTAPTVDAFSPSTAPIGTQVTITGINLGGATSVTFDGISARIVSDSTTRIVTSVPRGAMTGPIKVVTPIGTASSPAPFAVK